MRDCPNTSSEGNFLNLQECSLLLGILRHRACQRVRCNKYDVSVRSSAMQHGKSVKIQYFQRNSMANHRRLSSQL